MAAEKHTHEVTLESLQNGLLNISMALYNMLVHLGNTPAVSAAMVAKILHDTATVIERQLIEKLTEQEESI